MSPRVRLRRLALDDVEHGCPESICRARSQARAMDGRRHLCWTATQSPFGATLPSKVVPRD